MSKRCHKINRNGRRVVCNKKNILGISLLRFYLIVLMMISMSSQAKENIFDRHLKPYTTPLFVMEFPLSIIGINEDNQYITGLSQDDDGVIMGRVNGTLKSMSNLVEIIQDNEGNRVERVLSSESIIHADDGSEIIASGTGVLFFSKEVLDFITNSEQTEFKGLYYMVLAYTFRTDSEKYNYLNRVMALGREVRVMKTDNPSKYILKIDFWQVIQKIAPYLIRCKKCLKNIVIVASLIRSMLTACF